MTEPTLEQIAQWLAQAEANDWGPDMSVDDQCAVLRLALRTLDAERAAEHWRRLRKGAETDLAAMTERAKKAEHERDEWKHTAMARTAEKVRAWTERDARPEISREDAAAWVRHEDEDDDYTAACGRVGLALRAHAAGSGAAEK